MNAPRLQCSDKSQHHFYGTYRKHFVQVERDHPSYDWYILVVGPDGICAYDGWWCDSKRKPVHEAVLEALRGSLLYPRPS